jgi:small-conductance mechanosensitive channel
VRLAASLLWASIAILGQPAPSAPGEAAEQKTPAPQKAPAPAPPPSPAIPLPQIAARATEVSALLRTYEALHAPTPAIATIEKQLPEISARIGLELQRTLSRLQEQPTLETLEAQQQLWTSRQLQTTTWLNALTQRAARLEEALTRLAAQHQTWTQTQDAARAAKAPEPTLQQIAGVLAAIEAAQTPLQAQRATALDFQSRVSQEVARCQTALARVAEAQEGAVGELLRRNAPPIWSAELWARWRAEGPSRLRQIAADRWAGFIQFFRDPATRMPFRLGFLVILAALFGLARRWVRRAAAAGEDASFATAVFDRPISAALLLGVVAISTVYWAARPTVRYVGQVVLLVPAIRLSAPVVGQWAVRGSYWLAAFYVLDIFHQLISGTPLLEQGILALEMLAGIAVLARRLTIGVLSRPQARAAEVELPSTLRGIAGVVIVLFALGVGAAALGYLRLARLLASSVLGSAYLGLVLVAFVRVATGLAALALRMWPVRLLRMVQHHRDFVERRARRVLIWIAFGIWVSRLLDYVGLLGPALGLGQAVLAARLERGALSISLEDVLAFLLTLWVAYLLSAFFRFALEEDVYPRVGLARGLSYALSSLLNYVIFALGFLAGLAVLGLDLTKLTVLAGAFGVGIGFGLQSVVNNFVSGLILLFERPIHVGDTIEAGDILGNVRRIGIRASVVRTWQGAEIIVPNAQLTTERVTNWTYSDQLRRIDLPVGVNYGAHPKKVMEILEAVARAHPQVLRQPAPKAFFTGFGDSSINFELRAWTDQFAQWFQIRSELAAAVFDAIRGAGISFPFPQREIRLLRDTPADTAAAPPPPAPEGHAPG